MISSRLIRTPEQGYIDNFNVQEGLARIHSALTSYEGDVIRIINKFFGTVPKLDHLKMASLLALEIPGDAEKREQEMPQAVAMLVGNTFTGLALNDQGYYRGMNQSNIRRAHEAYSEIFQSGEDGKEYVGRQSESLLEFADHFPDCIGVEGDAAKAYWYGTTHSYLFARQIGIEKTTMMSN